MKIFIYKLGYIILTFLNFIFPKDKRKILIYGDKFLADNSKALYDYLISNNYNDRYKIVCLIKDADKYSNIKIKNVIFKSGIFNVLFHHFTSKYVFLYISCLYYRGKPKRGQIIFNLWHGSPLKTIGYLYDGEYWRRREDSFTYMLAGSDFFKQIIQKSYHCRDEQIYIGGNPRNDLLFSTKDCYKLLGINKNDYKKIILWMPTWRSAYDEGGNKDSDAIFPVLNISNIVELNEYLRINKVLLMIKPHPLQDNLEIFEVNYSNINVINNAIIEGNNVELYELLGQIDILLTDYSSVYFDFLITEKPIGFVIDDFFSYGQKRRFVIDSPLELMPGEKIYNYEGLIKFIDDILNNKDKYIEDRKKVKHLANRYIDGDNTKRILDFLSIT